MKITNPNKMQTMPTQYRICKLVFVICATNTNLILLPYGAKLHTGSMKKAKVIIYILLLKKLKQISTLPKVTQVSNDFIRARLAPCPRFLTQ